MAVHRFLGGLHDLPVVGEAEIVVRAEIEDFALLSLVAHLDDRPLRRGDLALDLFETLLANIGERLFNTVVKRRASSHGKSSGKIAPLIWQLYRRASNWGS
ncbi:MAG: hypothetical protein R3C54_08990 [Parvularculaceae bacterium]